MTHQHRRFCRRIRNSTTTANSSSASSRTDIINSHLTTSITLHLPHHLPTISLLIRPSPPSDLLFRSPITTTTKTLGLLCPLSLSPLKTLTSSFKGFPKTTPPGLTTNPLLLLLIRRRFSRPLISISISFGSSSAKNHRTRSCLVIFLSLLLLILIKKN